MLLLQIVLELKRLQNAVKLSREIGSKVSTKRTLAPVFVYNETFWRIAPGRTGNEMAACGPGQREANGVHRVCIRVHASAPAAEYMSTLKGHLVSCRRPGAIQTAQNKLINSPKGLLPICAVLREMKCLRLRAAPSGRTTEQKEEKNKIPGCQVSVLHH